ncbi:MAG TPA: DUF4476 domain-containing protein, partial [Flavisolibacter sp.]
MKTIFTLLLATVFTTAFAFDEGRITITTAIKKDVQVYVDGRLYQEKDNMVVLNSVRPGNHTIKIYKKKQKKNGNNRYDRNSRNELVYSSTVYVRPSYHVDVMVNRFGKALVDERALNDRNDRWDDDDWDRDDDRNDNRHAITDHEFDQLLQRIRNQWFGRLGNAKDALNEHYFRTSQVRQILQLFSSESDKLELAKLSYKNIIDRHNFRQLYDLFSYQSQAELDRVRR